MQGNIRSIENHLKFTKKEELLMEPLLLTITSEIFIENWAITAKR